jgi:hypothetical protein
MESSIRLVCVVQWALLASIVLLASFVEWIQPAAVVRPQPYFYAIAGMGIWTLTGASFFRRKLLMPAEKILSTKPDDEAALRRWRAGYIAIYAVCDNVAIWGVVLRFLGFSLLTAIPFYLAGFLLLLYFAPRPPTNAIG